MVSLILYENPLADVMDHARGEGPNQDKRADPPKIEWRDSRFSDGFDSLARFTIPTEQLKIVQGFQKLQIAPVACRISETISAAGTSSSRNPPRLLLQHFQCRHAAIRNAAPSKIQRIPPIIDAPPSCPFATIRRPKTENPRAKPSKLIAVDIFATRRCVLI